MDTSLRLRLIDAFEARQKTVTLRGALDGQTLTVYRNRTAAIDRKAHPAINIITGGVFIDTEAENNVIELHTVGVEVDIHVSADTDEELDPAFDSVYVAIVEIAMSEDVGDIIDTASHKVVIGELGEPSLGRGEGKKPMMAATQLFGIEVFTDKNLVTQ